MVAAEMAVIVDGMDVKFTSTGSCLAGSKNKPNAEKPIKATSHCTVFCHHRPKQQNMNKNMHKDLYDLLIWYSVVLTHTDVC